MSLSSRSDRYSTPAIVLHWLLALAIVVAFTCGVYMVDLPFSPQRLKLYNWHKWLGISILALSALRLLWRLLRRPPALPVAMQKRMPAWQRAAHHGVHLALYLLFFAVPLLGWAYSSAAGVPIVWLGVLPLPDWVPANADLADAIKPWHGRAAMTLALVTAVHVAAAFKHQWVDRDGLLLRMGWPQRSRRTA